MKRQIRKGVFETNSSSTHAICISKEGYNPNTLPKSVAFSHGDFGWEFEIYGDVWDKAAYLYEALHCVYNKEELDEAKEKLQNILSNYGIDTNFEPDKSDKYGYESGYIDHGYETSDFVFAVMNDENKLMTYLFGDSMVITGNDNTDSFRDYMYDEIDDYDYQLKEEFSKYDIYKKGN